MSLAPEFQRRDPGSQIDLVASATTQPYNRRSATTNQIREPFPALKGRARFKPSLLGQVFFHERSRSWYCRAERSGVILQTMATIFEIEKLALTLPEQERATLAANLLDSLPGVLSDQDEGVAEALRRDAEIDADPNQAITLAQLVTQIQSRRR